MVNDWFIMVHHQDRNGERTVLITRIGEGVKWTIPQPRLIWPWWYFRTCTAKHFHIHNYHYTYIFSTHYIYYVLLYMSPYKLYTHVFPSMKLSGLQYAISRLSGWWHHPNTARWSTPTALHTAPGRFVRPGPRWHLHQQQLRALFFSRNVRVNHGSKKFINYIRFIYKQWWFSAQQG